MTDYYEKILEKVKAERPEDIPRIVEILSNLDEDTLRTIYCFMYEEDCPLLDKLKTNLHKRKFRKLNARKISDNEIEVELPS
ncbi:MULTISPECIES: hypothetical protein [Metallosphaera]|uniref:hypothetical protein n=1 Tax=Bacteria TaxID=2 RepID=UPI002989AA32|nr:hypothetical protein [Metallosphaera sedula]MCP6729244.1 hypothetical protein [Metallosphaera sedula]MCP6729946.1 hypothetical protein [Metallosphaera sedula]